MEKNGAYASSVADAVTNASTVNILFRYILNLDPDGF